MSSKEGGADAARQVLLDQLAHLAEEIAAFADQIEAIPADILDVRPVEEELSIKEIYSLLAAYDEYVYTPAVEALGAGEAVELSTWSDASLLEEEAWAEMFMPDMLRRIELGRKDLVDRLEKLEDWQLGVRLAGSSGNVYDLAYAIVQHDTELLRTAARRIHEIRGRS